jgi:hypothetical protein
MINLLQDTQNPARRGGVIVKFDTSSPREASELAETIGNEVGDVASRAVTLRCRMPTCSRIETYGTPFRVAII